MTYEERMEWARGFFSKLLEMGVIDPVRDERTGKIISWMKADRVVHWRNFAGLELLPED